ncbi:MAG: TGS domain-containing protein, partial [Tidjanibacter sp.]|nr:TGS domain-containing protein [Tidjanibacter sp.]
MIKITFPDGNIREYAEGVTAMQIAEGISQRLAQEVLSATVNDVVCDLNAPINQDSTIKLNKWDDEDGRRTFWHTSSHLLAEALESLYPGIK